MGEMLEAILIHEHGGRGRQSISLRVLNATETIVVVRIPGAGTTHFRVLTADLKGAVAKLLAESENVKTGGGDS